MSVKTKRTTQAELEDVNVELKKAIGENDIEEEGGGSNDGNVVSRLLKSLDRSVDALGKAVVGRSVSRSVENDTEYEVSDGTSDSEPTTSPTTKTDQQTRDGEVDSEVGNKNRYGKNAERYPNRNRVNKSIKKGEDVEEELELVEDEDGNIFAKDADGNLYEVEEEQKSLRAGDRFLNKVDENGEFVEIAEGSDALLHLTKSMVDTLDEVEASVHGHLMEIEENLDIMMKSMKVQSEVLKAMIEGDDLRKSMPIHNGKGVRSVIIAGKDTKVIGEIGDSGKVEQREMLRKAVVDGKMEARFLNLYSAAESRGLNGLVAIPDTVLKSLGLEESLTPDEIRKAQDMGLL